MKIILVSNNLQIGGMQRVTSRLGREWAKSHAVITVIYDTSDQAYEAGGRLLDFKLPIPYGIPKPKKLWLMAARITRTVRLILREKPDRMVGIGEDASFILIIAGLVTGTLGRVIPSVRVSPDDYIPPRTRNRMRMLYRLPRKVVAVSGGVKSVLESWGLPRVVFMPNAAPAVVNKTFPPPPVKKTLPRYILAVGRLHKQKGFDLLLNAYAALPDEAPPLVILGDGDERAALTALIKTYGLKNRVLMPGRTTNVGAWYQHAEMFVFSSRFEGWPNVIPEAMAHGCPVVSFACPTGPDEIIQHGKNGLLVKNGDVTGLAKAMATMLDDSKLRQRLATAGKTRAADFAIDRIAHQWLK